MVLDAAAGFLHYLKFRTKDGKLEPKDEALYRQVLVARAKLGKRETNRLQSMTELTRPELSHHSWRVAAGAGLDSESYYQELLLRAGLHDFLNDVQGFDPYAAVNFFSAKLRFYNESEDRKRKLTIEELRAFRFTSLPRP